MLRKITYENNYRRLDADGVNKLRVVSNSFPTLGSVGTDWFYFEVCCKWTKVVSTSTRVSDF